MTHREWKRSVAKQFKEKKRIIRLEVDDSSLCRSLRAVLPRSPKRGPPVARAAERILPSRRPEIRVPDYKLWFMSSTWQKRGSGPARRLRFRSRFLYSFLHAALITLSRTRILRPCNFYKVQRVNCHKLESREEYNNHTLFTISFRVCLMTITATNFFILIIPIIIFVRIQWYRNAKQLLVVSFRVAVARAEYLVSNNTSAILWCYMKTGPPVYKTGMYPCFSFISHFKIVYLEILWTELYWHVRNYARSMILSL